jgi:hypothetical protein
MATLKMTLDSEKYTVDLDKITLGEARLLKDQYGMEGFDELNFFDPDQLTGLFVVAVKRAHPELSDKEILAKVEGIESGPIFADINKQIEAAIKKVEAEKADPLKAGASASAPARSNGSSATTRKKPGSRRSPKS